MSDDAGVRFSRLATSTVGNALDQLGYVGLEVLALAEKYEVNDKRALVLLETGQSFSEAMRKFNSI